LLAKSGLEVICCDRSPQSLEKVREVALQSGVKVKTWQIDLEIPGNDPLPENFYGGILVFRYLNRPLIPCMTKALREGGLIVYETFTVDQLRFGKPHNPNFLLRHGELESCFGDYEIIHSFEGIKVDPERAIAQIVARKPISIG